MSSTNSSPPARPLRILVVDDHEESARALSRLLRHEGHVVTTAHSIIGAMALIVGQRPVELLLSDIDLPDGDGCDLLGRLRAFYGGRDIPAVALTGHGEQAWVEQCRQAGYRTFLLKPVRYDELIAAVRELAPTAAPVHHDIAQSVRPLGGVPAPLPGQ
jgi:two-component system, chemotaxis family, CheB/CheR fusion protein